MTINQVTIEGYLTRDPNFRHTNTGLPVCSYVVAVRSEVGQGDARHDETAFVPVTTFGRQAEADARHLAKGSTVTVIGRLRSWNQPGIARSGLDLAADRVIYRTRLGAAPSTPASTPPSDEHLGS